MVRSTIAIRKNSIDRKKKVGGTKKVPSVGQPRVSAFADREINFPDVVDFLGCLVSDVVCGRVPPNIANSAISACNSMIRIEGMARRRPILVRNVEAKKIS